MSPGHAPRTLATYVLFQSSVAADLLIFCAIAKLTSERTGISVIQSWNTANLLNTRVELNDTLAQGLKTELISNFNPAKGNQGQKLNLYFKQPMFHTRAFFDYNRDGKLNALCDGVLSHEGLLVGGEVGYDVQKAAITKYSAALGYTNGTYTAAVTSTNSLSLFSAFYHHKVNSAVEAGAKATWDSKSNTAVGIELAAKYKIDPMSFAKVRACASTTAILTGAGQAQQPRHRRTGVQRQDQRRSHVRHRRLLRHPEPEREGPQDRLELCLRRIGGPRALL